MSFVDLATLAMHKRAEMESRISELTGKCAEAINNVKIIETQGLNMVNQLNCEPSQLKDRFLSCMKLLDEYIYMVNDFNLSFTVLADNQQIPVPDLSNTKCLVPKREENLLDLLSSPLQASATAHTNQYKREKRKIKKPAKENVLIAFSSSSSQESFPEKYVEKEMQCDTAVPILTADVNSLIPFAQMNNLSLMDRETESPTLDKWNLPAQEVLQAGPMYNGSIIHVDGNALWLIADQIQEACKLMVEMTEYYRDKRLQLSCEQVSKLNYCAYYDEESQCTYRCLFIGIEGDMVELFLVDTGEVRLAPICVVQPLVKQFSNVPPFARCCYLAGLDSLCDTEEMLERQEKYLKTFLGQQIFIMVDDNTSESLGVYIVVQNRLLNEMVVEQGFAVPIEGPLRIPNAQCNTSAVEHTQMIVQGPPGILPADDYSLTIDDGPEYEDPVEAVTGYHNRDEMDICKHYKGEASKTCFKGARCKKRHVMKHPDGWTLDKVEVRGKGRSVPLPPPGTWHRCVISCVPHYDHVFIQLINDQQPEEQVRQFGVLMPPMTLQDLIRDMNSPASKVAMRPLKIAPAPGELVASLYPLDQKWYRAVVLSLTNHDQSVEVRYVDFGTDLWVKEDHIRELNPCYMMLPHQAIRCRLAGVKAKSNDPEVWIRAKNALIKMVMDKKVECQIIARHYDELEIELLDEEGKLVAQQLADLKLITLTDYSVQDDSDCTTKIVP